MWRPALAQAKGEYRLVAGSNREAEFSAYEEGRQTLLEKGGAAPDVWIILNDRLPFYGPDCLWGVTPALLQFAKSVPIAAGTIDFLPRYFQLCGQEISLLYPRPITFWYRRPRLIASAHSAL